MNHRYPKMLQFQIHQGSTFVPGGRNRQLRCQHQLVDLAFSVHCNSLQTAQNRLGKYGKIDEPFTLFIICPSFSWNPTWNPWKCVMSHDVPWTLGSVQALDSLPCMVPHGPMASLAQARAEMRGSGVHVTSRGETEAEGIGMENHLNGSCFFF